MRITTFFFSILFNFSLMVGHSWGQSQNRVPEPFPGTILWKITGGSCSKPSYLLGTFHLAEIEWLLEYPTMKKAVDSTEFILNEAFTTKPAIESHKQNPLKALPLLDKNQFNLLDSFFVARVGEGLRNNKDAAEMTVAEMEVAIITTLIAGSSTANGVTTTMDKELFALYVKLGRKGDRLDRIATTVFDSSEIDHAKQYLKRALGYIANSDKPDWNIYQTEKIEDEISVYKQMKKKYNFDEYPTDEGKSDYFDFVPVQQRNKNWMPKIIEQISDRPCLIAVGLYHLYYKTGIIMLLRSQGYRVEPVILSKP